MAKTNASGNETSLKGLIQGMTASGPELMEFEVTSVSPLKLKATNDDKLIITERITIVPWHLTDYTTKATLAKADGALDSQTYLDGEHGGHTAGTGAHRNNLETFTLTKGTLTVYNALKVGEKVHVLALNSGKLYYVLDRVAGQVVS